MNIKLATFNDIRNIIKLIQLRIEWMNENNIHQWNKSNYLETFTLDYFKQVIDNKNLYVIKKENITLGAFTLFETDARWNDEKNAFYIHNFVSAINSTGVGDSILSFCETKAKKMNIPRLRIDCQKGNEKLNDYYAKKGFVYIDSFDEENYKGNRREKTL